MKKETTKGNNHKILFKGSDNSMNIFPLIDNNKIIIPNGMKNIFFDNFRPEREKMCDAKNNIEERYKNAEIK